MKQATFELVWAIVGSIIILGVVGMGALLAGLDMMSKVVG